MIPSPPTDPPPARNLDLRRALDASFAPVGGVRDAEALVRRFARGHYENFSVVSLLVARARRQDFYNLYAFCRAADDLADEAEGRDASLRLLDRFRRSLSECFAGRPAGAVFVALRTTVERYAIPIEPFLDLISAFEQDQRRDRYETFDELLDYCRRSANPVGRLVLYVHGHRDEMRQRLSDHTCTALQLTNFWQDARRDFEGLGRIYFPGEWMKTFGVNASHFDEARADARFKEMVRYAVGRTDALFDQGDALLNQLSGPIAAHVSLFGQGGRAILDAIRDQDYDTLSRRPTLSRWKKARLVARVVAARAKTMTIGFGRRE